MSAEKKPLAHGILLVDKAPGGTSHDVVAVVRKVLHQREVGHAGTLDPMATGLLVVLLGEATKLALYLTNADKSYATTIRFGVTTDSLDADGTVTDTQEVPAFTAEDVHRAIERLLGPRAQIPPAVSAIKVGGVALHERVRRGETVEPEARNVVLHRVQNVVVRSNEVTLELFCSKGFYVRSFARDLAKELGTIGHLTMLRRLTSGAFSVREAVPMSVLTSARAGNEEARKSVRDSVLPLRAAARAMPLLTVDETVAKELRQGKKPPNTTDYAEDLPLFVVDEAGTAVCIAVVKNAHLEVLRGFVPV